jgi:hypothetical protein
MTSGEERVSAMFSFVRPAVVEFGCQRVDRVTGCGMDSDSIC